MVDKVQNVCNSECHTPLSESFRSYAHNWYGPGIYPSFRKLECLKIQLAKPIIHITFLIRCKSHCIIPKGLSFKNPANGQHSTRIVQCASKALLRDKIHFHCHNKVSQLQRIQHLENFLKSSVNNSEQHLIFAVVESSFRNIFNKQKAIHICKISRLHNHRTESLLPLLLCHKIRPPIFQNIISQTMR
jgi:hypothetical protein